LENSAKNCSLRIHADAEGDPDRSLRSVDPTIFFIACKVGGRGWPIFLMVRVTPSSMRLSGVGGLVPLLC